MGYRNKKCYTCLHNKDNYCEVKKQQVSLKSKACKHHKVNNNGRTLAHVCPKY